jgi:hypothetical protein
MDELGLSARAHDRILRVARTIADLEGAADLRAAHVVEAIGYRGLDRKLWQRSAGATGTGPGGLVGRRPKKQGRAALVRGRRGLPGGSSLNRLLRAHLLDSQRDRAMLRRETRLPRCPGRRRSVKAAPSRVALDRRQVIR